MHEDKDYWLERPGNLQRLLRWFYVACAVLIGIDLLYQRHGLHPWEHLFGFYGIYGFVACVVLVVAAKEMRRVLMRKEDYYGDQ